MATVLPQLSSFPIDNELFHALPALYSNGLEYIYNAYHSIYSICSSIKLNKLIFLYTFFILLIISIKLD